MMSYCIVNFSLSMSPVRIQETRAVSFQERGGVSNQACVEIDTHCRRNVLTPIAAKAAWHLVLSKIGCVFKVLTEILF